MSQESEPELIHDFSRDGGQSMVYKSIHCDPEKPICIKMYAPNLSLDIAQSYVDFHKTLNDRELEVTLDEGIEFLGKRIQLFKLSFAKMISDMIICPIDDLGNSAVSSYSEFIEGNTLSDLERTGKITAEDKIQIILGINEAISDDLNLFMSTSNIYSQIDALNLKVLDIPESPNSQSLIITDIACDIKGFVEYNQKEIERLITEKIK